MASSIPDQHLVHKRVLVRLRRGGYGLIPLKSFSHLHFEGLKRTRRLELVRHSRPGAPFRSPSESLNDEDWQNTGARNLRAVERQT